MIRIALIAVLLLPLVTASLAADPAEPTETVVRMKVQPMAVPTPALKFQLLPEIREINPGNPVQAYLKCFSDQRRFFYNEDSENERERWLEMPLKELPIEKLRHYGGSALAGADYGARLDKADWQILLQLKSTGARTILPDIQQMRLLARALEVRFRAEIADRRFEDAVVTAKTLLAMSRHVGEHPAVVARLVGAVVANFALDSIEEMVQQPGCPNLFWAIASLPDPFLDLHGAADFERTMFDLEFSAIDETTPMTKEQIQKVIQSFLDLGTLHESQHGFSERFEEYVRDQARVDAARKRLTAFGLDAEKSKQFPPAQVILLDEKRTHQFLRDDVVKLATLPYWQAEPLLVENEAKARNPNGSLFPWLAPWIQPARTTLAALEQRIALLRCIEALRLYAAEHDSKLPTALADIPMPLPVDPVTGTPFSYQLDGATAKLHGTPPRGKEKDAQYNRRYEVTIQK
jgi:hypothetical protein